MSVNGIPPALSHLAALPIQAPRRSGESAPATSAGKAPRADHAAAEARRDGMLPAALQAATLWDLLDDQERAFFSG